MEPVSRACRVAPLVGQVVASLRRHYLRGPKRTLGRRACGRKGICLCRCQPCYRAHQPQNPFANLLLNREIVAVAINLTRAASRRGLPAATCTVV